MVGIQLILEELLSVISMVLAAQTFHQEAVQKPSLPTSWFLIVQNLGLDNPVMEAACVWQGF